MSNYNKGFYQNTNYYYIHRHKDNIGKAYNGNRVKDGDISAIFKAQRKSIDKAIMKQYSTLMLENINYGGNLNDLIETQFQGEENFLNALNSQMKEQLNKCLDIDAMRKLHQIEHTTTSNNNIINLVKNSLNSDSSTVKGFDNLLEQLEQVCELMTYDGGSLAAIISNARNKNMGSREGGIYLLQALEKFKHENNNTLMKYDSLKNVVKGIEQISHVLANPEGFTKSNNRNSSQIKSFKTLLENTIFSTSFAEGFAMRMKTDASNLPLVELGKSFGDKTTQIQVYDSDGNRIQGNQIGSASYGKADVKFNNFSLSLNESGTNTSYELGINLGLSVKFYKGHDFMRPGQKKLTGSFSAGSGGPLDLALDMTFADTYHKYLAYNTLARGAHGNRSLPASTESLNDLIAHRQLVNLFGARGLEDFSQFLFANGQLISLGEIINYALNTDLGKSASMGSDAAIVISIDKRENILGHLDKEVASRVAAVDSGVKGAIVKAKIHLDKLSKAMKKT